VEVTDQMVRETLVQTPGEQGAPEERDRSSSKESEEVGAQQGGDQQH
jgi:hypothetical protein